MPLLDLYPTSDVVIDPGVTKTPDQRMFFDKIDEANVNDCDYISIPNENDGSNRVLFGFTVPDGVDRQPIKNVTVSARVRIATQILGDYYYLHKMRVNGVVHTMNDGWNSNAIGVNAGNYGNPRGDWEEEDGQTYLNLARIYTNPKADASDPTGIPPDVNPVTLQPWQWGEIDDLVLGIEYVQDWTGGVPLDISRLKVTVRYEPLMQPSAAA